MATFSQFAAAKDGEVSFRCVDDDTPQGRARKRIKSDINPDVYRMHMLGPNDEGIVLDCSVRARPER